MGYNVNPLVLHAVARPTWLPNDRFWYRTTTEKGPEVFLVDAERGTKSNYTPPARPAAPPNSVLSPDGKRAVFIRDFNLWVRDLESRRDTQLTRDGVKDFGYGTDNAGWTRSDTPVVLWSPDSKRIATFQHDGRGVGEMYLADTRVGHPHLEAWKYPLVGDEKIFQIERVIIDVDAAKVIRLKMPPDPHRSSLCDHVKCDGSFSDVEWSADSKELAFISTSRDHKRADFRVADAQTGKVRNILGETSKTYFEGGDDRPNWRFLPASNEVIWFSERDNWGQLYLYDLTTGKLKNQITSGEGTWSRPCAWMGRTARFTFLPPVKRRAGILISSISIAWGSTERISRS
jgi:Tol biopolymer transport system component